MCIEKRGAPDKGCSIGEGKATIDSVNPGIDTVNPVISSLQGWREEICQNVLITEYHFSSNSRGGG